jgi:hypothetical protein
VKENERLAAVRRYDILNALPDRAFDRITALAARLLNAPIAIVSIVDHDRIWFKSRHGIGIEYVERDLGLCASCVLQESPWLISDARSDARAPTRSSQVMPAFSSISAYPCARMMVSTSGRCACLISCRARRVKRTLLTSKTWQRL